MYNQIEFYREMGMLDTCVIQHREADIHDPHMPARYQVHPVPYRQSPSRFVGTIFSTHDLQELVDAVSAYKIIGIQNCHLFPSLSLAKQWAEEGKRVIVTGLDSDRNRVPYSWLSMTAQADEVEKVLGACSRCPKNALFSGMNVKAQHVAFCRKCYALNKLEIASKSESSYIDNSELGN